MELNIVNQAVVFADLTSIQATPDTMIKLIQLLKDDLPGVLPSTSYELQSSPNLLPIARPNFTSPDNEWALNIGSRSIDLFKNSTSATAENMRDLTSFCELSARILGNILGEFGKVGKRVSFVTNSLITDRNDEQMESLYHRLVRPVEFYESSLPEWHVRTLKRIPYSLDDRIESTNVITTVARVQGKTVRNDLVAPLDGIHITIDINTVPEASTDRLGSSAISEFYPQALSTRETLMDQLRGIIYIG